MEYYLIAYKVTLDYFKSYHAKIGVTSKDFSADWELAKVRIFKGLRLSFPNAKSMEIEMVGYTKVSLRKYNEFHRVSKAVQNKIAVVDIKMQQNHKACRKAIALGVRKW